MNKTPSLRFSAARWTCGALTKTGRRHLAMGRAGQDAASVRLGIRPFVLVADGRGSSAHSAIGSAAAPACLAAVLAKNEDLLRPCLDLAGRAPELRAACWARVAQDLHQALTQQQTALARHHHVPAEDLEFTLAAAVAGEHQIGIVQLGDSCVAIARGAAVELALPPDQGEYANETRFVSPRAGADIRIASRIIPRRGVTGLMAFTDGLAPLWLHTRTLAVAPGVGTILRMLGNETWDLARLEAFLDRPVWRKHDDDKGVAYLARRTRRRKAALWPPTNPVLLLK